PEIAAALVVGSGEKSTGVRERTTEIVVVADPSAVSSPPAGALPLALPILLLARRRRRLFLGPRALREMPRPPAARDISKCEAEIAPGEEPAASPDPRFTPNASRPTGSHGLSACCARCNRYAEVRWFRPSILAARMKSFSCRPLIFFVCSRTVA